ncbi:MAG: hypothetical protein OHK0039_02010 [Bacteroidia bacterium]
MFCLAELYAQPEADMHLQSIRSSTYRTADGLAADSAFVEFAIRELLQGPQDIAFISNRNLLSALCLARCGDRRAVIHDTLRQGRKPQIVELAVHLAPFDSAAHRYTYFEGSDSLIETIDGQAAYGAVDRIPRMSIDSLTLHIDGRSVKVPPAAYRDLYDPSLCDSELFRQPIAVYPSLNGRYLYLYLYGGQGAGTYFAKLVFDKNRYLTRILAEYPELYRYGAFRREFIGF